MIRLGQIRGHAAVWLENDQLSLSVLPGKGADIYQFIHRPTGIDLLYKTVPGLAPPPDRPPADFVENYEGGWQELFPNTWDACEYRGLNLPAHGEAALLAWDFAVEADDERETAARFSVVTRLLPFRLERVMRLQAGSASVGFDETVTNLAAEPVHFVWGHHLVVGGDFLEAGCRYEAAARTLLTPDAFRRPANARLAYGQRQTWPLAQAAIPGETIDLRAVPGPDIHLHDVAFLTDLERGEAAVVNPRLGLKFTLTWEPAVFGCIAMWQPYGGVEAAPWIDSYGVGLEPWTTCSNLAQAVRTGAALHLRPGESLSTRLTATVGQTK